MRRLFTYITGALIVVLIVEVAYAATVVIRPGAAQAVGVAATATKAISTPPVGATTARATVAPRRTPTDRPAPTVTPTATATVTATPSPTPTATPAFAPVAPAVDLGGITQYWQTWNNCGPATLAMYLSYYGSTLTQDDIRLVLRPNDDDKNVNPDELVAYARSQGFRAVARYDGSAETLRLLLSNGAPVIIETWHEPEPDNGMGHYRLVTGYDGATGDWIVYDSYDTVGMRPGDDYRGLVMPDAEVETLWPVFNRVYVAVYTDENAAAVEAIVGAAMDDAAMWQRALAAATEQTAAAGADAYAWFNLGNDYAALGCYPEAVAAYRQAQALGWPRRMFWTSSVSSNPPSPRSSTSGRSP